jgi:hypothetical protein
VLVHLCFIGFNSDYFLLTTAVVYLHIAGLLKVRGKKGALNDLFALAFSPDLSTSGFIEYFHLAAGSEEPRYDLHFPTEESNTVLFVLSDSLLNIPILQHFVPLLSLDFPRPPESMLRTRVDMPPRGTELGHGGRPRHSLRPVLRLRFGSPDFHVFDFFPPFLRCMNMSESQLS